MVDRILELEERKIQLLAPVVSHRKGTHEKIEDIGKRVMYAYVSTERL